MKAQAAGGQGRATPHSDLQTTVDLIEFDLSCAGDGSQPAYRLSMALSRLARRGGALTLDQFETLERAVIRFNAMADEVLPRDIDRRTIAQGLEAAYLQVCYWASSPERRQMMDIAEFADMEDFARKLRNEAHNSAINGEIQSRANKRKRAVAIASFSAVTPTGELKH